MTRLEFIVHAVDKNAKLPYAGRVGQTGQLTVQELAHLNVTTLRQIGKHLEKLAKDNGSSRFEKQDKAFTLDGIKVDDWMDFVASTIELQENKEKATAKRARLAEVKRQLEESKTPEEKRKDLEKELAQLEAE